MSALVSMVRLAQPGVVVFVVRDGIVYFPDLSPTRFVEKHTCRKFCIGRIRLSNDRRHKAGLVFDKIFS